MDKEKLYNEAVNKTKEIIKDMNGLSEEGLNNRLLNDSYFRRGFFLIADLFMQAKFGE